MTTGCDFRNYHRLKKQVEEDLQKEMDSERYHELLNLQRRCFPTKEQVIEDIEAFYATQETSI